MLALALAAVLCWLRAGEDPRWWLVVAALAGAAVAVKYEALPLLPALWIAGRAGTRPPPSRAARDLAARGRRLPRRPPGAQPAPAGPGPVGVPLGLHGQPRRGRPARRTARSSHARLRRRGRPPRREAGLVLRPLPRREGPAALDRGGRRRGPAGRGRRRREDVLLLVWACGYLAAISVVPFGFARYLAPALPALALLGGLAVAWLIDADGCAAAPALAPSGAAALAVPLARALPYPALYVNALGGGSARALHWSPDDAGGNLGMTRAVAALMGRGGDGEVAVADPTLVRFLSGGRLRAVPAEGLPARPVALRREGVRAVVVQPSQISLGNRALFDWLLADGRTRPHGPGPRASRWWASTASTRG